MNLAKFLKLDRLLIAGIDPGTVGAYVLLDLEGNIIKINSGRGFDHKKMVFDISKYGKVFLVGCDVKNKPGTVVKVAKSVGAKVVGPDHDLGYLEKIKMVDSFLKTKKEFVKLENKHEKDALAAALCGLKSVNGLIKKIEDHLEEKGKKHLFEDVKKKVLVEEIPIVEAVRLVG